MPHSATQPNRLHRDPASPALRRATAAHRQWSFVYCFFSNHMPFCAPNRSEPCPGCR